MDQSDSMRTAQAATMSAWEVIGLAAHSSVRFLHLIATGSMHLCHDRIGELYRTDRGGVYDIFRETLSDDGSAGPTSVLVVGFRLRLIRSNFFLHRVFQRICILTTPIWSGFPGYRVKLWMVDPQTRNYLGIYEWAGERNAQSYVDWLACLLVPLSTRGSVWYELYPGEKLSEYLSSHREVGPGFTRGSHRASLIVPNVMGRP